MLQESEAVTLIEEEQILEQDMQRLRGFRPMDDTFFRALLKDYDDLKGLELAQFIVRILIGKPDLILTEVKSQADMKRVTGSRSVCLDAYGTDSLGKKYDIEIQRAGKGAEAHRARYHSSILDVENLHEGQKFEELPDTYTVFITEEDFFKKGAAIYPIQRMNTVTGEPFHDGAHIIYVNGEYRGEDDIGKLMHDFNCNNPADMNYKILAERAKYLKENPKGVDVMCKAMDDLRMESERRGELKGFIEACQKLGKTISEAVAIIAKEFDLTDEASHSVVAQYWNA